jgi:hypothetical protein
MTLEAAGGEKRIDVVSKVHGTAWRRRECSGWGRNPGFLSANPLGKE